MNFRYRAVALFTMFALAMLGGACAPARDAATGAPMTVSSPDGNLSISVALASKAQPYMAGERLYYRVAYKGIPVLADSPLGLDLSGAGALDHDFEVVGTEKRTNDSTWENAFGAKRTVPDRYNELVVSLREKNAPNRKMDVVLRAYDEGVAFRYVLPKQDAIGEFAIAQEMTGFYFAHDASAFALNLGRYDTSNEGEYARTALRDIKPASLVNLPVLVEMPEAGLYAALLEADLTDYAGLYVGGVAGVPNALTARLSVAPRRPFDKPVIGATPKSTPWRVIMAGPDAGRFIEANYLILNLSAPCAIADTSWIKPGKAAWDWWSGSYRDRSFLQAGHEHGHDEALHRFRRPPQVRIHARRRGLGAHVRGRADRGHPEVQARGRRARDRRLRQVEGGGDAALGRVAGARPAHGRGHGPL